MKRLVLSLFLLLIAATITQPASAQAVYGSIFGTVTDQSGAAVPNAKVTVTDITKGTSDIVTTNAEGNYSATHLIPDQYKVEIEAGGFKKTASNTIQVSADTGSRYDAKLEVGANTETVEVTSEAPQLKTDRADVATTLNERAVENLPILNRNFTSLELLTPGAQVQTGWSHASQENPQGSQQIYVNGQHFSGTGYELDGTDNQDPILGIIVINPNLDAITETKMDVAAYDAEFGKAVGGIMTVQTKSGSNDLHGEAFWYRRTDATQARDPFTQYQKDAITHRYIPATHWNQAGGTLGGPIIKNKLFFFGDYQGTRQASGTTNQLTVPLASVIKSCTGAGDGSGYCKLDPYVPFIGNGKPGDPSTLVYDPNTGSQTDGSGRTPFCGPAGCATQPDWIPLSRISTQAQKILALFPAATNGSVTNNFIGSGSGRFKQDQFDTRIDYEATPSLNVFGRFSLAYFTVSGAPAFGALGGVGFGLGGYAGQSINHDYSLSSGFTKTFSPTLLTDFRFGWFKYNPVTSKPDQSATPAKDYGIPNLNLGDYYTNGQPAYQDVGPISDFGDGLGVGRCNCPLTENEQQFQFVNNWTKMHGNHQLKFGGDIRFAKNLRIPSDNNRTGELHFRSGPTSLAGSGGLGLASFLLGDVADMQRYVSVSTNASEHQKRFFFYGQDTWRATQKLTINYGLRWELYSPENVNAKGNGGFANPVDGVIRVAGYGSYNLSGNVNWGLGALAPRLGIAYQLNQKTVIRMGYGRSFDMGVFGSNFGHVVTQNLPVLVRQSVNANNNGKPGANGNIPAFTLSSGPPLFVFPAIPSNGQIPLLGPNGDVNTRIRPTYQRLPTLDAWNVTVQRQLTKDTSIEVGYVGNKGTHVFSGDNPDYDINQVPIGPGAAVVKGTMLVNGVVTPAPAGTSCSASGVTCSAAFVPTVPDNQRRRFYNAFSYPNPNGGAPILCCSSGMDYYGNGANSHYNSLQVRFDRRFSKGLQLNSFYVYSHATSYDQQFVNQPKATYGPTDQNRNHVWVTTFVYELPFGKGKSFASGVSRAADLLIGGWQLTDTTNLSSGLPWTPTIAECGLVGSGDAPCRPDVKGSFHMSPGSFDPTTHTVPFFTPVSSLAYNISATTVGTDLCSLPRPTSGPFSLPACGTIGNATRGMFRGPKFFADDIALSKNFGLTERFKLQFRMDVFNVFNHPILDFSTQDYEATGGNCVDCSGNNGKITDIIHPGSDPASMRNLQFALKLFF